MSAITDKISLARIALLVHQPFFGTLAMMLRVTEDKTMPMGTMGVDGVNMFYDPNWVEQCPPNLLKSAIAHEVMHCALLHCGEIRRGGRNSMKWNIAIDFAVNDMLKLSGFELGEGWLWDQKYRDTSAEHIYDLLPDMPDGQAFDGHFDPDFDPSKGETLEQMQADWKGAVVTAAMASKQAGNLPSHLERFIDSLTKAKVDWRSELRRFVNQVSKDDYSFTRPNKNYYPMILPSMWSEATGPIVVVVDTSGSVDEPTLRAFASEVDAIMSEAKPEITHLMYCAEHVSRHDQFPRGEPLKIGKFKSGGTDFRPPFEKTEKENLNPVCLIYLTDGYGPFPNVPPEYPTLWVMVTPVIAPFGETLRIEL